MWLIRYILIDLALTLLGPENAHAITIARGGNFKSATKATGSLIGIPGPEASIQLWREPTCVPSSLKARYLDIQQKPLASRSELTAWPAGKGLCFSLASARDSTRLSRSSPREDATSLWS
ncbi:hypothetical protein GA0061098_1005285 [Bradyrhizobium shewense]|uniref:Uncharacterized protein n=1 Tax=Bradyrhizobium shewense TaxID=1761772 RepID=A0A1C3VV04_9BRAD|nr:hypothetical protein GA0061098_1005285 [Bradyrhizobium shewense]